MRRIQSYFSDKAVKVNLYYRVKWWLPISKVGRWGSIRESHKALSLWCASRRGRTAFLFGVPRFLAVASTKGSSDFLNRIFSVAGVSSVEINRSRSFARVHYDSETGIDAIWRRLSQALKAATNAEPARTFDARDLYLDGPQRSIRVGRIGTTLSTWQLRSQSGPIITSPIRLCSTAAISPIVWRTCFPRFLAWSAINLLRSPQVSRSDLNPRLLNAERLVRQLGEGMAASAGRP